MLNTAGVTLGSGEGGNAFGDRFFIRGFDARNDVFIDGIRDPGVSVRENFFTEQIEILRGPGSSFAGRGTTGGAINIVTKQATTEKSFYNMDSTFGTDHTKRVMLDVNQVISPTLAIRAGGMFQDANVAGRNYVTDDRWGGFVSAKWTPTRHREDHANYIHTDLSGLPDFGVPYYRPGSPTAGQFTDHGGGPYPISASAATISYGFVNRDFQTARQDIGTLGGEYKVTDSITLTNRTRAEHSLLDYIGTLPNARWRRIRSANGRSTRIRRAANRSTEILANQEEADLQVRHGRLEEYGDGAASKSPARRIGIDRYTGPSVGSVLAATPRRRLIVGASRSMPATTRSFRSAFRRWIGNPTSYQCRQQGPLCHGHRQLAGHRHPERRHALRRLRHQGERFGTRHDQPMFQLAGSAVRLVELQRRHDVFKPVPIGSLYAAYATSTNPFGSELDGTGAQYGGWRLR